MNLEQLNQYVYRYKAILLAICIVLVLILMSDNRITALAVALVFMCLSSIGDMVLGYYKFRAGMGFVQTLIVPVLMFLVFFSLAVYMGVKLWA